LDIGFNAWLTLADTRLPDDTVEIRQGLQFGTGVPAESLGAHAELFDQRPQGGKLFVDVVVVTLDHHRFGHGLAGYRITFTLAPFTHIHRLAQLGR
jgi:hypothetical protein